MGPTCGPSGADRSQVDPMLAPWTLLSGTLRTYDTLANLLRYQLRPDWVLSYGEILMSKTSRLIYYLPHLWYISLTQIQSSIGSVQRKMQPYVYAHRNRYDSLGMCTAKQEHGNKMFHDFRFLWDFALCHIIDSERHSTMLMLFRSLWSVYLVRLFYYLFHVRYIYIYLTQIQWSIGSVQNFQYNSLLKCNHVYTHIAIDIILLDYLPLSKSMVVKHSVIITSSGTLHLYHIIHMER